MVVGLTFYNSTGAINLLSENESDHLVGEGHWRQANALISTLIDSRGETVRSTYAEDQTTGGGQLFVYQPVGKLHRAEFLAPLIEQNEVVRGLEEFENLFALALLLLLFRERLGILEFRNDGDGERHVMRYPANIIIYACLKMFVVCLANEYQFCLHQGQKYAFSRVCTSK